jgi:diadenosine tetraphosphate (Ap4A) HIT family hydrolase
MPTNELAQMPASALTQLGTLLAQVQRGLEDILNPEHLYIGRYGHTAGQAFHFHLIPVCSWVKAGFFGDSRYRVLQEFSRGSPPGETDGAEMTLYVWREFCERPDPPAISGPSVDEVVARLKLFMSEIEIR